MISIFVLVAAPCDIFAWLTVNALPQKGGVESC